MLKSYLKKVLLYKRGIHIDNNSDLNFNVKYNNNNLPCKIKHSHLHITEMGEGCFIENAYSYGNIHLGRCVSISGPGTVLHAEIGKIVIGDFCSIAQNVSIVEFNHNYKRVSTWAFNYHLFNKEFSLDVISNGDIIIGEDVWIGSNSSILSGVKIGRGAIIAAGAVVTKDIPPYTIAAGIPAKVIRKRFSDKEIKVIEDSEWWKEPIQSLSKKQDFLSCNASEIKSMSNKIC